jgi:DNA-binding CsgD family transcriptional regulator
VRAYARAWNGSVPHDVRVALAGVISAVGSDHMNTALAEGLNRLTRTDRVYAFVCARHRGPDQSQVYAAWTRLGDTEEMSRAYNAHYRRCDPINEVVRRAASHSSFESLRLTREEIPDSGYRRVCFDEPAVCERRTFLVRVGDDWGCISLSRADEAGYFRREELEPVAIFAEIAVPLLARHSQLLEAYSPAISDAFAVDELQARLEKRFPELTRREREVCARTMVGMTAEAISIDLCIGRWSVQTYRQRAYKRLNICSAYQLAPLVLT